MKYIIIMILFSFNASASTKQETYYNSCYGSYFTALVNISDTPQDRVRKSAKELCQSAKERWDKDGWDTVKYPMFQGCWNAMQMVYIVDMEPKLREKKIVALASKICASIGKR